VPPTVSRSTVHSLHRPPLPDVVSEHFEEFGFLSVQRRKLLFSPEVVERRVHDCDERRIAHWDGLAVNRPESVMLAEERLHADDPWDRVTAAKAWLTFAMPSVDVLAERWIETPIAHTPSWSQAMRDLTADEVEALVPNARRAGLPPIGLAALVDALGWHGRGSLASAVAAHPNDMVRAAAARALGLTQSPDLAIETLRSLVEDDAPAVVRRALWSIALLAPIEGCQRARQLASGPAPDAFAVRLLGLLGDPNDYEQIAAAAGTDAARWASIYALGDLGTERAAESLVRLLAFPDETLKRVGTDALEMTLGPIRRPEPDAPATVEEARAKYEDVVAISRWSDRLLNGLDRPWIGEAGGEPMAWIWRRAIGMPSEPASAWLRREVPDGFFTGLPGATATPGE